MSEKSVYSIPITSILPPEKKAQEGARVNSSELLNAMQETGKNINDAKGVMELLPDVVMAKQILVASVLSPRDAQPAKLDIRIDGNKSAKFVKAGNVVAELNRHFSTTHDLDAKIETILGDVLFDYGSYINIYLPPTELNRQISEAKNISVESINDTFSDAFMAERLGFIGGKNADLANLGILGVTDRLDILRRPSLERAVQTSVGLEQLGLATKLNGGKGFIDISSPNVVGKDDNPLVYRAPSDAVIPVIEPGRPDAHVGYFVLLDERGGFLSNIRDSNQMEQLVQRVKAAREKDNRDSEYLIVTNMGRQLHQERKEPQSLINAYIDTIESELKDALKGGYYGDTVEVTRPEEVYRVMFARALTKRKTRILYVPKELVSYYAYEYDAMGIGESLMDRTRFIASLRAILLISDMMGSVKNSVSETVLNVELDEDEVDPTSIISTIRHEYSKLQTNKLPAGELNPSDIITGLQNGSVRLSVSGGSKFPNTKLDVEDRQRSIARTDTDLSDQLKKLHMNGLWTIPELVDQALEGETATSIIASNNMMARRAATIQRWFKRKVSEDIRRYIRLSGPLTELIKREIDDKDFDEFLEAITVYLPEVNTSAIESQMEQFTAFSDGIDSVVETYISEDMLTDMVQGDSVPDVLLAVQTAVAAHFKRKWLQEQGMFSDLHTLYSGTDEDDNIADSISEHYTGILESIERIVKVTWKKEFKVDQNIEKAREKFDEEEEEENSDSPGDTSTDGGDAGDVDDVSGDKDDSLEI